MIKQILVFEGLKPEAVNRLHAFFDSDAVLYPKMSECTVIGFSKEENDEWRNDTGENLIFPLAKITESTWDPQEKCYRVAITILVEARVMDVELTEGKSPSYDERFILRCPRSVIDGIYKALDLFPPELSFTKLDD